MRSETLENNEWMGEKGQPARFTSKAWLLLFAWLVFTARGYGAQLTLNWSDNSDNEEGFKIERAQGGAAFAEIGSVGVDVTSFTDSAVIEGQDYTYRVRAHNAFGFSDYSNIATGSVAIPNTAPTISSIADIAILQDQQSGPIPFTIGDAESEAAALGVSATSSNQALLPDSAIELGGSGSSRWIDLSLLGGASGTAVVTITVSDGEAVSESSFVLSVQSVTPPMISSVADVVVAYGEIVPPISFSVGDVETFASDLTVTVGSSNLSLLPVANMTLSGTNAERVLELVPAVEQWGSATVTIQVDDGSDTTSTSFLFTVESPPIELINTAPTISPIADIAILQDESSNPLGFTVGDGETEASLLTVSAISSNQALLPDSSIALGGSGSNRTIALYPASGASGIATITITVSDGTSSASGSFLLTVETITAPTISSIADIDALAGESIAPIAFLIGDKETLAEELVISAASSNERLLPSENIAVTGTSADRALELSPVAGELGSAIVTVTVSDGTGEAMESFVLRVLSPPVILTQPATVSAFIGEDATFTVEASAFPEPVYQWRFNGTAIDGANGSTLTLSGLTEENAGSYSVVVENSEGSVASAEATLNVQSNIAIVQEPVDQTIDSPSSVLLSISAEGSNLTYQWYLGESGDRSSPLAGATSSSYQTGVLSQTTSFWVEIFSGNESQNSKTVVVYYVPMGAYYFGTFEDGQGAFGLMIRSDRSAALLAHHGPTGLAAETADLGISADGSFIFEENGSVILSGRVDGSIMTGAVASGLGFSGAQSESNGLTAVYSGFYYASLSNTPDGQALLIAGPNGQGMVTVSLGVSTSGAAAVVKESGRVTAILESGESLTLTIDSASGSVEGKLGSGRNSHTVSGQREDIQAENTLVNASILTKIERVGSARFTLSGPGQKTILIRGLGPSLESLGVADAVRDTTLSLYRAGEDNPIAENDDWGVSPKAVDIALSSGRVGAFPLASDSKDAALLLELPEGDYTAYVSSVDGIPGTVSIEAFDADEARGLSNPANLTSVSLLAEVGIGQDLPVSGFIVSGNSPKRFLLRAMGSELEQFGFTGTLADPKLTLHRTIDGQSVFVAENDNWQEDGSIVRRIASETGAFPFDRKSKSSGMVIWLDPGVYTAIVSGADGVSSGVVLVEVYEAP